MKSSNTNNVRFFFFGNGQREGETILRVNLIMYSAILMRIVTDNRIIEFLQHDYI